MSPAVKTKREATPQSSADRTLKKTPEVPKEKKEKKKEKQLLSTTAKESGKRGSVQNQSTPVREMKLLKVELTKKHSSSDSMGGVFSTVNTPVKVSTLVLEGKGVAKEGKGVAKEATKKQSAQISSE